MVSKTIKVIGIECCIKLALDDLNKVKAGAPCAPEIFQSGADHASITQTQIAITTDNDHDLRDHYRHQKHDCYRPGP